MTGSVSYTVLMPMAPWEPVAIVSQALASLRDQTLKPAQVVVSCDGDPPSALLACLQTCDLPVQVVVGPGGEGVGPVLARGLLLCNNDLVLRADADDLSLPDRAEKQVAWMQQHPNVLVMSTPILEFLESPDQIVTQRWVPVQTKEIARIAHWRNPINHPAVIFRRSAVLAAGNYHDFPGFEDYELWLRMVFCNGMASLANTPDPLVLARVGNAHLARRHGLKYALSEIRFFVYCWQKSLLPTGSVIRSLVIRLPLRLVPANLLSYIMKKSTRRSV